MLRVLPTAITDRMLVTASMMPIRPRSLLQHQTQTNTKKRRNEKKRETSLESS